MFQARKTILIGLASLLFAMLFNFLNTHFLNADGVELRGGQTVATADDASYIAPADNFYAGNGWKGNSVGLNSNYLRSPGYGCIYLLFKVLFPDNPFLWLRIFQILLFAISTALLYETSRWFIDNELASACVALLYGITPFACGFLSYTLTEGVTPAFVIFFIYSLSRYCQGRKWFWLALAVFFFAILFVIRPVLGVMLPLLPLAVWLKSENGVTQRISRSVAVVLLALMPMCIWQVRNWQIAGRYVGLHPIYSVDSPDLFRPAHKSVWNFERLWAPRGDDFHASILGLWQSALNGDTTNVAVDNAVLQVPDKVLQKVGRQAVADAFGEYQRLLHKQVPFFVGGEVVPQWFVDEEKAVVSQFEDLERQVRSSFPLMVHVVGPAKVYGRMVLHSNLSMYMFQKTFRGKPLMEFFRFIFFAIHALLFVLIWVALVQNWRCWFKFAIVAVVAFYLVYLAWFQRGIEERYTLPMLPILLMGSADVCVRIVASVKKSIVTRK